MVKPNQSLKSEIEFTPLRYARCSSASVRRAQKGFTLIELMIVVAVIGILAGLAITFFGGAKKKSEARAEVMSMFTEIQVKQEQNMLEFNAYGDCGATNDEDNMFPASPLSNGNKTTLGALPAQWTALRITPGKPALLCGYTCVHGDAGANASVGPLAQAQFGFGTGTNLVPAADPWYYVLAHCDMDSDNTKDSYYFKYSADSELYFTNQGN